LHKCGGNIRQRKKLFYIVFYIIKGDIGIFQQEKTGGESLFKI
jgi:hypothetical protein